MLRLNQAKKVNQIEHNWKKKVQRKVLKKKKMYNEAEVEVKVRIEKIMEGQNQQQIEIKL